MSLTVTSGLIAPEVWAETASADLVGNLVVANAALVSDALKGQPGESISFPKFNPLSEMGEVAEDESLVPEQLTQSSTSAEIKSVGKAVEISDKALLVSLGDPQAEAIRQFAVLGARKIDKDLYEAALATVVGGIKQANGGAVSDAKPFVLNAGTTVGLNYNSIIDATALAGDTFDASEWDLYINSADRALVMKDPVFISASQGGGANGVVTNGSLGTIGGMNVFVSDRIEAGKSALLRKNSLGLFYKREALVESDRNILKSSTVIVTTMHYAVARLNDKGVVLVNWKTAV